MLELGNDIINNIYEAEIGAEWQKPLPGSNRLADFFDIISEDKIKLVIELSKESYLELRFIYSVVLINFL